tara:strand:- start:136 stop:639 length:504 start_codon:yes stop_codon:yes gene_type:complete
MSSEIINRVDQAGLLTLDLSSLALPGKRISIDMVDWLDENMIIREHSFKKRLSSFNWDRMRGCFVAIYSSKDIIVPPWAYLLIQTKLHNIAKQVFFSDLDTMNTLLFRQGLENMDISIYKNKRVFLKICSNKALPLCAISLCAHMLMPHVKSLFYGEPCSGVPLIKN